MAVTAIVGGLVLGAVGTATNVVASQKAAKASGDAAQAQMQANAISERAMELDSRRRQLETIRQAQIARARSTATAVSQNAQLSSGLQGGYGQISGQENTNLLGLSQNLDLGKEMAAVNDRISMDRISLASAQGLAGFGSGLSSIGGSLVGASSLIGRFGASRSGGFGSQQYDPQYFNTAF